MGESSTPSDRPAVRTVALIPARGGSKRIPRKNIRPFHGRPMIAWVIDAARRSALFDRIVVSTDDDEIAAIARAHGALTPFVRGAELSGDHAGTTEVVQDAARRLALPGDAALCCLYATAVLVQPEDLRAGFEVLAGQRERYVIPVCPYATPIQRAYRLDGGLLRPFWPEQMPRRSQDLEPAYFDAGQFYWARVDTWLSPLRPWDGALPLVLPATRVCDIDTPDDWHRAEAMFTPPEA